MTPFAKRTNEELDFACSHLLRSNIKFFHNLIEKEGSQHVKEVVRKMKMQKVVKNETIFLEGETGDKF